MNGDQQNNMFQPGMNAPEQKSSMVGTVIVILIIVLGVIYLLASRESVPPVNTPTDENTTRENVPSNENVMEVPPTTDELTSLEAELSATDLTEADAGLNQLDSELNQ